MEYNSEWELRSKVFCKFPKGPAPHDFAASENYYLFIQSPFEYMDKFGYAMGMKGFAQIMRLQLRQPTMLHVVDKAHQEKQQLNCLRTSIYIRFLLLRKLQRGNNLHCFLTTDERFFPQSNESVPSLGERDGKYPDFDSDKVPPCYLYRTVIDLDSNTLVSHQQSCPGPCH